MNNETEKMKIEKKVEEDKSIQSGLAKRLENDAANLRTEVKEKIAEVQKDAQDVVNVLKNTEEILKDTKEILKNVEEKKLEDKKLTEEER